MASEGKSVQIAIQGGGAKVVLVLAVAHALADLEQEGALQVSRAAGTSAGSIAVAMLMGGGDFSTLRQHLIDCGPRYVEQLMIPRMTWWNFPLVLRIILGKPLVSESVVKTMFASILKVAGIEDKVGALATKPTRIIAADIVAQRTQIFRMEDENTGDKLSSILWHSCGLPFVFKTYRNINDPGFVDGGICENLPSDILLDETNPTEPDQGPVLAVTFEDVGIITTAVQHTTEFASRLLATSMTNSVARAKLRQGSDNVFSIKTSIGTFDFERAVQALGDEYDRVYDETVDWFTQRLESRERARLAVGPGNESIGEQDLEDRVHAIYLSQHADAHYRMHLTALVVKANRLNGDEDAVDEVTQLYRFSPNDSPLYCLPVFMQTSGQVLDVEWHLYDSHGDELKIVVLPAAGGEYAKRPGGRRVIVFFTPPLAADRTAQYDLLQQWRVRGAMDKLEKGGLKDHLSLTRRREVPCEQAHLILVTQRSVANILEMVPKEAPPGFDTVVGRSMTEQELSQYKKLMVPSGYQAKGWTGGPMAESAYLGVNFLRKT